MKLSVSPKNRLVKVVNDNGEPLKGFIIDCISTYSVMYQKQNENNWNEVRVSYVSNPGRITVDKPYKDDAIVDILPDAEIKRFFIADTSAIVNYDNGKIVEPIM